MELGEFLDAFRREHGRCGAQLQHAELGWGLTLFFRVFGRRGQVVPPMMTAMGGGYDAAELRVQAIGVEDWLIAPEHNLLEGFCEIDLVHDDPRLCRQYLESLDCEGWRTDYPDRVVMLRFGSVWAIAERFEANWVCPPAGPTHRAEP